MNNATPRVPDGYKLMISQADIARRVAEMGHALGNMLEARERPVAVVVLQGAFVFAADLLRSVPPKARIEVAFLRCESYGAAIHSSGKVVLLQDLDGGLDLHGRTAVLVDDILDTGLTLRYLAAHMEKRGAARVLSCALLRREAAKLKQGLEPDLVGFGVGEEFFVGYGMDHAGRHRNLPYLAALAGDPRRGQKMPARVKHPPRGARRKRK